MTRPLPRRSTLLIALVIVVVDQLSKAAASSALREGQSLPLLPHLLSLQLVHNTGAAFSVLQGSTALLGLLSLGVGIGLILWIWRERVLPFWQALAAAALLGRWSLGLLELLMQFSIGPLPAQMLLCIGAGFLSVVLRRLLIIEP